MMHRLSVALLALALLATQGCGQTGPLYLPETDSKVVVSESPRE
jgi:predicted small lipoprotein YifL